MFNQLNNWSSDLEASGVPCVFLGKDTLFPDEMLWLGTSVLKPTVSVW